MGMSLYAVRIEDLHDPAKVDALHEIVDVRMPNVVAKYEKGLLDVLSLRQRDDKVPQISEPCVHLNDYNWSVAGQWPKRLLVVHFLLRIRSLDFMTNFRNLQLRKRSRARSVRQARRRITTLLQKPESKRRNVGGR